MHYKSCCCWHAGAYLAIIIFKLGRLSPLGNICPGIDKRVAGLLKLFKWCLQRNAEGVGLAALVVKLDTDFLASHIFQIRVAIHHVIIRGIKVAIQLQYSHSQSVKTTFRTNHLLEIQ